MSQPSKSEPLTLGSLFAGIGGIDLGFERAGMVTRWQVEIDDYARAVLARHWPNVPKWRDVKRWPQPWSERVDVIAAGFPCQDLSYAGRRAGLDGARSGLFYEAMRVVGQLQPRAVVLENVAGLLTRGMGTVLAELAALGFDAGWDCIPACAVGAPHIRDRVFVYAYRKGQPTLTIDGKTPRVPASNVAEPGSARPPQRQGPHGQWPYPTIARGGWWDIEPAVGRVVNGLPRRVDRIRALGNAVVPQVAEVIGRHVVAHLQQPSEVQNDNTID